MHTTHVTLRVAIFVGLVIEPKQVNFLVLRTYLIGKPLGLLVVPILVHGLLAATSYHLNLNSCLVIVVLLDLFVSGGKLIGVIRIGEID